MIIDYQNGFSNLDFMSPRIISLNSGYSRILNAFLTYKKYLALFTDTPIFLDVPLSSFGIVLHIQLCADFTHQEHAKSFLVEHSDNYRNCVMFRNAQPILGSTSKSRNGLFFPEFHWLLK
jgi:hypothetical protein